MTDTTQEAAAALMAALAKAQGEFKPIEKNRTVQIATRTGGSYTFRYADLEEILSKTRPALAANGLAMIQTIEHGQQGPVLSCKLMHAAGGVVTSEVMIPSARDMAGDPKAFGAAITYYRRYMVTAMLGVAADDDLDEDGQEMHPPQRQQPTGQKPAVSQPQRRQEAPAPAPAAQQASQPAQAKVAAGEATHGEIAYIGKKIAAAGLTVAEACAKAGIISLPGGDSLEGMSKADFAALKAVL